MKRKEFKEKLFDALKSDVDNMSYDEKMILVNNLLIDFEKENEYLRDTSNKGQKWKDEELKIILSDAPSKAKLYADVLKRGIAIARIVEEIQIQEEKLGIEKTIIVGDINENPYETGCLGASGFHGIPVYKDTMKKYRVIMDESFKMFYNPMWNLLGDFSFPPGTYYYSGNEVENSFWNVYDQVMIRPCLRGQFVDDELKILCETKKRKLIDANNHPDKKISDHLPIVFEIMED